MTDLELILKFAALFVLSGYLLYRHRWRVLSHSERRNPAAWTGHGIRTDDLRKKLDGIRGTLAPRKSKRVGSTYHRMLLRISSHTVTRLEYFRRRISKVEPPGRETMS